MPTITGKILSPSSISTYRKRLNQLSKLDVNNITDLINQQEEIIEFIEMICDEGATTDKEKEKEQTEKRMWLAAIDYALFDSPAADKQKYTQYYSTLWHKPGQEYKGKNGKKMVWVSREEYLKNKK